MAKITIELDTANGDTLDTVLKSLAPPPLAVEPPNKNDWSVFKPGAFQFTPNENMSARVVAPDAAPPKSTMLVGSAPDAINAHRSEPALTEMDGDRKRGEAGPGHRRRTNAQIKEDEQYLEQKKRAEAALAAMDKGVHPEPGSPEHEDARRARENEFMASQISSGEERVNSEDIAQDEADEADEAAETAARAGDKPTLEDLRAAASRYTDKFGPAATVKNMRAIVGCAIADVPADKIGDAIAAVEMAISGLTVITPNSPADAKPVDPATATKAEVVKALMAYGKLYDGSDNPEKMLCAKEDLPKVFTQMFGASVTGLGSLPNDKPETLGTLLAAIKHATDNNQFQREAKS